MDRERATDKTLVSVVITCYNHAKYLPEAIESVLAQSYKNHEIVVIDDGSTDDTAIVSKKYDVNYVFQKNQGLSAARNTGIKHSKGAFLIFLDADDRLLMDAIQVGVNCFQEHPEVEMVFGKYHYINVDGSFMKEQPPFELPKKDDHYFNLLHKNFISMHAAVMYKSNNEELKKGYNISLRACEDYDLYLRIAQKGKIAMHPNKVAEYRKHNSNMSGNPELMLKASLEVLKTQHDFVENHNQYKPAYKKGLNYWKDFYGKKILKQSNFILNQPNNIQKVINGFSTLAKFSPSLLLHNESIEVMKKLFKGLLKNALSKTIKKTKSKKVKVGKLNFGDLRRITPLSRDFGYDRGGPADRYYIENFLKRNAADIKGRVLEIKDDTYALTFGGKNITQIDILDIDPNNSKANIIADLAKADNVASNTYDCVILTQTLLLIYDVKAAITHAHRMLKPGGVLLVTVPGITQMDYKALGNIWYWSFSEASTKKLFEEIFPSQQVIVNKYGNVLVASSLLYGISAKELTNEELDFTDPDYQVIVTIRATK
ncbi:MAG: bifunctional glycosyltransferase/class I SAM-dependent methyltransferase [Bacteroidota bacterium]|nr:bifunctional glycosyltransferase/class I SAM-dependent methyltransferase [Bacteroidota bacterium]